MSNWTRRNQHLQRLQNSVQYHRRGSSSTTSSDFASPRSPMMGVFDRYNRIVGLQLDCALDVHVEGLRSYVSMKILYRNTTGSDIHNAKFRTRTTAGAVITFAECHVAMCRNKNKSVEARNISNFSHNDSLFECYIGYIQANRDCVVQISKVLRFTLPGCHGEQLAARQKSAQGDWNVSHTFPTIALDIQLRNFPERITSVVCTRPIFDVETTEYVNAKIELNELKFQAQEEIVVRIRSEPLPEIPMSPHAISCPYALHAMAEAVDAIPRYNNIPVINVIDDDAEDLDETIYGGEESDDSESTLRVESRGYSPEGKLRSRHARSIGKPPNIAVDGLCSKEHVPINVRSPRDSISSASSCRSDRERRRKTAVDYKSASKIYSPSMRTFDISWIADPSDDDEVDDGEWVLQEFLTPSASPSASPTPTMSIRDSITLEDDFDVEEVQSVKIVRPAPPRLVDISTDVIPLSLDLEIEHVPLPDFRHQTPPSSPTLSADDKSDYGPEDIERELQLVRESISEQLDESETGFLQLNPKFSDAFGINWEEMKCHQGAQASNLGGTPEWVREVIQDQLIDGDDMPGKADDDDDEEAYTIKAGPYEDPFVRRPISPPKTPDDLTQKIADSESFMVW